jgi:hypothetical protein
MVFVIARALLAVPALRALGEPGFVSVVWSCIALACFVPSLVISWRSIFKRRAISAGRAAALPSKTAGAAV